MPKSSADVAVLAVVTSSPPSVEGGHLVIARALVAAARDSGYEAHLVITPDYGFGRASSTYLANWRTNVHSVNGSRVDQVISMRYPSYAVQHPRHVCWLNHAMREYYDLWPRFSAAISPRARIKERLRRAVLRATDRWLLTHRVSKIVAQSRTIQRRVLDDFGIEAEVVYPPPPGRGYRCDEYGPYIFAISRLTPLKRLDLLIRALAEPSAKPVTAVIAGEGESRSTLEGLAVTLGVSNRVTFLGRIDDRTKLDHLARCRAVCFTPFAEDYGFVTVEAFASRKAVVTCHDSGGPSELVRHDENGLVTDASPAALAAALARLSHDPALAERLGARGEEQVASLTWAGTIRRLVIV